MKSSTIISFGLALVCSWYGETGQKTASGEPYDTSALTCASNRFKFGTRLRVTAGGRSVVVRVNDRTSPKHDRLDLSPAAFKKLSDLRTGLIEAEVEVLP